MRPYAAMLSARFLALLQYRVAALAGLGTQVFWGLLRVMVLAAFYRSSTATPPMTMEESVTYVWLGQATLLLTIWRPDPEIETMVRSGSVAYELLRPVDLYGLWFARSVASHAAPTLLRFVPLYLLALIFFGMGPPASPAAAVAWLASMLAALLLSAAIGALVLVSLLWTISGQGLSILLRVSGMALSGILLPLPLFPDWCQPVLDLLPFRGLMDVPFRLYLGHIAVADAAPALALQCAWILALIGLGRCMLRRGMRRVVIHGG